MHQQIDLREFCVTHVILTPGACGREGPTGPSTVVWHLQRQRIPPPNSTFKFDAQVQWLRALPLKTLVPTMQIEHPEK